MYFKAVPIGAAFFYNRNMRFEGVIFDLDGTLLDSNDLWLNAGKYYLDSLNSGITVPEDLGKILYEMNMEQGAEYLKSTFSLDFSLDQIIEGINNVILDFYARKIQCKTGVIEFLQYLKNQNIPFSIATSTDRQIFVPCLKRLGIYDMFSNILTCSELQTSKSKPDIYLKTAQLMETSVTKTLVFEDAPYALETAFNAGFPTVAVYDKFTAASTDPKKIHRYATFFIEDFSGGIKILEG